MWRMDTTHDENAVFALVAMIREQANDLIVTMLAERGVEDVLPAHGAVLHVLFTASPVRMSVLAERIGRRKSTLTSLVTTLESRGYCRRETDRSDSRAQLVSLTEKGERLRGAVAAVSTALLEKAWSGIPARDRQACMKVLTAVSRNLRQTATAAKE